MEYQSNLRISTYMYLRRFITIITYNYVYLTGRRFILKAVKKIPKFNNMFMFTMFLNLNMYIISLRAGKQSFLFCLLQLT